MTCKEYYNNFPMVAIKIDILSFSQDFREQILLHPESVQVVLKKDDLGRELYSI